MEGERDGRGEGWEGRGMGGERDGRGDVKDQGLEQGMVALGRGAGEGEVVGEEAEAMERKGCIHTVTEEKAGHLGVFVHTVEVVFVLLAVVLESVGDVEGQALA
jgi:hypothetical protein